MSRREEVREARRELQEVVTLIRRVDGFADFLEPLNFPKIAQAASAQPLLYLVPGAGGGFCLMVTDSGVEHVALPLLSGDAVWERTRDHLEIYRRSSFGRQELAQWDDNLEDLSAWLWDAIMGPLVVQLEGHPAATFINGGVLGLLPLHLASTRDWARPSGRRYMLDELAVSYVPNAQALVKGQGASQHRRLRRFVGVADPKSRLSDGLPWTRNEVEASSLWFPSHSSLVAEEATLEAIEALIPDADVLHLATHGTADLLNPMRGGLLLADDTVWNLDRMLTGRIRARLVVLSACETSLPGLRLPDEVVSLPTGMLEAGAAGVVGSMWAVPDQPTAVLMTEFYRQWIQESLSPAEALRRAQIWIRDTTNGEKVQHWLAGYSDSDRCRGSSALESFVAAYQNRDPSSRDDARTTAWGAFAHFGV